MRLTLEDGLHICYYMIQGEEMAAAGQRKTYAGLPAGIGRHLDPGIPVVRTI